ncbi:MAG: hypothetical protein U9N33_10460, partial [Campylobacterota bacterium]|nr:hypothetical protein [Campylobacterota bacterium]
MDNEFLDVANKIRKRLANDFDELELLVKKKKSKYNKELYVTKFKSENEEKCNNDSKKDTKLENKKSVIKKIELEFD